MATDPHLKESKMTNKIETLYATLTMLIQSAGIANVLRIPDEIRYIGNNYPMALIQEGQQVYTVDAGQRYIYTVAMRIYLCTDMVNGQSKYMNDLQVAVFNQLFANANLSGFAMNCNPISVDPGAQSQISELFISAGYNDALVVRAIDIEVKLQDVRY